MATAVTMPQMGESVVEGTVTRWYKNIGDPVDKLEPLIEIATDKIDTDVPAPAAGVLLAILVEDDTTVAAGTVLGYIGAAGEEVPAQDRTDQASGGNKDPEPQTAQAQKETAPRPVDQPGGRSFISPVVARLAAEHQLDLSQIEGTGLGGRITKKDVLAFLEQPASERAPQQTARPPRDDEPSRKTNDAVGEESIFHPLTTMRKAIAGHMTASKQTSPHVTTVMEADMTAVVRHRAQMKAAAAAKGVPLTYTAYFLAAAAAGLRAEPIFNSRFTDDGIVEHRRIHIGVAVSLAGDQGLMVPVIRDADEKSLMGLARAVADAAQRARSGAVTPDELTGGTFTISNHGTGGSLVATPIINQPQAGILGVGAVVKRPVVHSPGASLLPSADDAIVIRPMCYLSLTFDHRIADGAQADRFLAVICNTLENWPSD